jgi:hypothetical protein
MSQLVLASVVSRFVGRMHILWTVHRLLVDPCLQASALEVGCSRRHARLCTGV